MICKITVLLFLVFQAFKFNKASLSTKDAEILAREYSDFRTPYFHESTNPLWKAEVDEVLHLLGVNENIDRSPMMLKRKAESKEYTSLDLNLSRPKFKWQYTLIATVCSIAAITGVVVSATCYYKMYKVTKNNVIGSRSNSSNNGSGIVALGGSNSGDKKLAQSAQMYHYQHQKQQIIAFEKADSNLRNEASDEDSEPDDAVDDFTVYECPGMAMGGELEVKNPLFQTDPPSPTGANGEI